MLHRSSIVLLAFLATCNLCRADDSEAAKSEPRPRVLIIGDSISLGYTKHVAALLKDKADVRHNPGNAGNTGRTLPRIAKWLDKDQGRWDVIHFNWGLWDLCYRNPNAKSQGNRDKVNGTVTHTPDEYRKNLEKLVGVLKKSDAKLIWASTTPVPPEEAGRKVGDDEVYNRIAAEVMKEHAIPTNDLHALMNPHMKTRTIAPGNVHFKEEGSKMLAKQVAAAIEKALAE